jgi:hypothetical protein
MEGESTKNENKDTSILVEVEVEKNHHNIHSSISSTSLMIEVSLLPYDISAVSFATFFFLVYDGKLPRRGTPEGYSG